MKASTQRQPTSTPLPDLRLAPAGSSRATAAGLAPDTGGRRDQARSRRSGLPLAPEPHRRHRLHPLGQAGRTVLAALGAWSGERYGIDPAYLGVLLAASFELGVQRLLGK